MLLERGEKGHLLVESTNQQKDTTSFRPNGRKGKVMAPPGPCDTMVAGSPVYKRRQHAPRGPRRVPHSRVNKIPAPLLVDGKVSMITPLARRGDQACNNNMINLHPSASVGAASMVVVKKQHKDHHQHWEMKDHHLVEHQPSKTLLREEGSSPRLPLDSINHQEEASSTVAVVPRPLLRPKAGKAKVMAPPGPVVVADNISICRPHKKVKNGRHNAPRRRRPRPRHSQAPRLQINKRLAPLLDERPGGKENIAPSSYQAFNLDSKFPSRLGIYTIYKQATKDFHNGMAEMLPKTFRLKCVDDYKRGADYVVQECIKIANECKPRDMIIVSAADSGRLVVPPPVVPEIDPAIFRSIDTAIRLRQEQMLKKQRHHEADRGHQYIISAFIYVRDVLDYSQRILDDAAAAADTHTSDSTTYHRN